MSTSGKGKASASMNSVEAYSKEALADEIRRLNIANVQLIQDKQQADEAKTILEADR